MRDCDFGCIPCGKAVLQTVLTSLHCALIYCVRLGFWRGCHISQECELKGDARLPIRNVFVENVKVDTVRQFINRLSNVENFQANEVSATILLHKEAPSIDLDKLYKQKAE